jgi:hypothetical protein
MLVAFGLMVTALAASPGAGAQEASSITIHHRLCPGGYTGGDYFTDCHDQLAGQSFEFTVESGGGIETLSTDAATGNVTFSVVPGGVEIYGGVPGEFAETFVYCSQDQVALELSETAKGVAFDALAGEVVCDWYNTPIDLSGDGDGDSSGDDGGEVVTELPNTGAGAMASGSGSLMAMLLPGLLTLIGAGTLGLRTRSMR